MPEIGFPVEDKALFVRRINEALIECGFQPTLPSAPRCTTHPVSTHAPLAGSDRYILLM